MRKPPTTISSSLSRRKNKCYAEFRIMKSYILFSTIQNQHQNDNLIPKYPKILTLQIIAIRK